MTVSPNTDHICEPGGFYSNICNACKIDIANGLDARYAPMTPAEVTARRNRDEATARRAVLDYLVRKNHLRGQS